MAKLVTDVISEMTRRGIRVSSGIVGDVLAGSARRELTSAGLNALPAYGKGKTLLRRRVDTDRIIHRMVTLGYLFEDIQFNPYGSSIVSYRVKKDIRRTHDSIFIFQREEKDKKIDNFSKPTTVENNELYMILRDLRQKVRYIIYQFFILFCP